MMPVSWSTYAFSVSIRSLRGLVFLDLASEDGFMGLEGVTGVVGVKGMTRPAVWEISLIISWSVFRRSYPRQGNQTMAD